MNQRAHWQQAAGFEAHTLNTLEDLELLRTEWQELWAGARDATPFQAPGWLIPWCRRFARDLTFLALRHGGRLVGLIPWTAARSCNGSTERMLTMAGAGISDYLDGIFATGFERAGAEFGIRWLRDHGWEGCDLGNLPSSSPFLTARAPSCWTGEKNVHEVCPVLPLPPSAEELREVVPSRQLEKLRYYRARARRECIMEVECADRNSFTELFDVFVTLHRRRWEERGECGVLADPAVENFHYEAAAGLLNQNRLRLYVLRLGAARAGALYVFIHHGRAYYYLAGFDPKFKVLSPGMLLIGHAIEQAISEGADEFDFMRGREAYKYAWGAVDRATFRLRVAPARHEGESMR
jgi:CelD/BcsL family acetyltransferase involved in cellulose biosynthesis